MSHEALQIPREGVFPLLKPLVGFRAEILARLERHPYERNVFLMLKFRPENADLSDFILETLARHGFHGVRADQPEWNITNNVYNPVAVLYCCKYGIALFDEAEPGQTYSANVAYELGMMHLQRKTCLLLKHASLPQLPFDLIKDLYVAYERELSVRKLIGRWIEEISATAAPKPAGPPSILTIHEEAMALGSAGLAHLLSLGLRDAAPLLDVRPLLASAEEAVDVASPLFFTWLDIAREELRRLIREKRAVVNFVLLDPAQVPAISGYEAGMNAAVESIKSLVDRSSKAAVSLYVHPLIPGYSIVRADERMIVSPWGDGSAADETPSLLLERRDEAGDLFSSYLRAQERLLRSHARLRWTNRL
ncbi:MAG TPA: hypothetical protein VL025_21070 [Thermoanaerobaculia bacterium]|nr:hypothetical protein [Thermoanaerobaculia bacterium]